MRFSITLTLLSVGSTLLLTGCPSGGVGDPCIPEDEYLADFAGFDPSLVSAESRSYQCETRLCLVANFQGRVSCPYGSTGGTTCTVPGTADMVTAPEVLPQLLERRPDKAVYCSCRCAGADKNANYCECPSGYSCSEVIADLPFGDPQLEGSYCIKQGTKVDNPAILETAARCGAGGQQDCGPVNPYGF